MSLANLPELFAPLERTLPKMLMRQAERYGERRLVTIGGKTLTHAGTLAAAAGYAGALAQAGVKAGDRVAIMCGNRAELLLTILGCGWLGAVAVPINTASRGAQLEHILGNCGARLMVIECGLTPVLASLARERIALEALWLVGDGEGPDLPHLKSGPFPGTGERPSAAPRRAERHAGDPLHVRHYRPVEGRVLPARPIFLVGASIPAHLLGVGEADVLMTTLPMFHTNALNSFYQALLNGATLIVEPRFSASGFIRGLAEQKATVTFVLGAMVPILLAQEPSSADRAHRVRVALAPAVPAHFHRQFTSASASG